MRFQTKLLGAFIPLAILSGGTILVTSQKAVKGIAVEEAAKAALSEATKLASDIAPKLPSGGEASLLPYLQRSKELSGALYVIVLDPAGNVRAHTNVLEQGKRYKDPLTLHALRSDRPAFRPALRGDESILDVSAPIWKDPEQDSSDEFLFSSDTPEKGGRRLGTIRLGLPLKRSLQTAQRISHRIFLIVATTGAAALGFLLFLMRRLLAPIRLLAEGTEKIRGGMLGASVAVRSADELGDLAQSFNLMSGALAKTTVSKDYFDEIIKSMLDSLLVLNPDRRIRTVNRAALDLLGYEQEGLLGKPAEMLHAGNGDGVSTLKAMLKELERTGSFTNYDSIYITKDLKKIPVSVSGSVMRDKKGVLMGFLMVARDIRETKRLTEEAATAVADRRKRRDLERSNRMLEATLGELKRTQEQLIQSQKMEAIGNLAGVVAHDFNNLLTSILSGCSFLLRDMKPDDANREEVEIIKSDGERAARLTRQLLAFSRKQTIQPKVLDLNVLVADMQKLLRRLLPEDIELAFVREPALGRVKADPGQMEQVIMNLAVNARDAMPRGGTLTVKTANVELDGVRRQGRLGAAPGSYVMVSMSDNGCGMDQKLQNRIFDPFFTTKELGKGTGLGLSAVYEIIQRSGGDILVRSETGRGSTFEVYFPRIEGTLESPGGDLDPPESLGGSETVLLAEDDDRVRSIAARELKRQGYVVLEARDGEEALAISVRHTGAIDLLVTDVVMPRLRGTELAERIVSRSPATKVLFISGYTDQPIACHGGPDTQTDLLQKPFTPGVLASSVRKLLDSKTGARHS